MASTYCGSPALTYRGAAKGWAASPSDDERAFAVAAAVAAAEEETAARAAGAAAVRAAAAVAVATTPLAGFAATAAPSPQQRADEMIEGSLAELQADFVARVSAMRAA